METPDDVLAHNWWVVSLRGLAGILFGLAALLVPGLTFAALVIRGELLLALGGIASIGLGVLLALFPGPGALALTLWIGAYALVCGAILVALSLRLRSCLHNNDAQVVRDGSLVRKPLSGTSGG